MPEAWSPDPDALLAVDADTPLAIVYPRKERPDEEPYYSDYARDPEFLTGYAHGHQLGMRMANHLAPVRAMLEDTGAAHQYTQIYPTELQRSHDMGRHLDEKAEELRELADAIYSGTHDVLTGLLRREALPAVITKYQEAEQARRATDRKPLTVTGIMVDIDHFKKVNDTHGHPAGDDVLRETAQRLSGNLREGDYAFRLGGEEFLLLLSSADAEEAAEVAERLRIVVSESPLATTADGTEIAATASFGVAEIDLYDFTRSTAAADLALYFAKNTGRDKVVQYDPGMHALPEGESA